VDPSVDRAHGRRPGWVGRIREKTATTGVSGTITAALNRLLVRGASIEIVQLLLLRADEVVAEPVDLSVEMRFLTSDEVRGYAAQRGSGLSLEFAQRIDRGFDFCFAAVSEGRLAGYCWLAIGSVEPEHSAGVALGLPTHMAYLYKAFTFPGFRGRRLYAALTAGALRALGPAGITQLVAFVYWNNTSALRACARMGYRRLGMMVARPSGPLHVPEAARRRGIRFGDEAEPLLEGRHRLA
jgi:hypothetical protein